MNNEEIINNIKTANYSQLENIGIPDFDTTEELNDFINNLIDRPHDKNTQKYAVIAATVSTFRYINKMLNAQDNIANQEIFANILGVDCPSFLVTANDMLHPLTDIRSVADNCYDNWLPWAADESLKLIEECGSKMNPDSSILKHWEKLAAFSNQKRCCSVASDIEMNEMYIAEYADTVITPKRIFDEETCEENTYEEAEIEYEEKIRNNAEERGDL